MSLQKNFFTRPSLGMLTLWFGLTTLISVILKKGEFVLWLNEQHSPMLDSLMKGWTLLGDGWMFALGLLLVVRKRLYHALPYLFTVAVQTLLVNVGKRWLLADSQRPKAWFGDDVTLNFVEGVKVHLHHSFPSGHTATAFTLCFLVWMLHRNTWSALLALGLAIGVGVSRMYLVLHFWEDVFAGSCVALISVIVTWLLWYRKEPQWSKYPRWNWGWQALFRRNR